MFFLTRSQPLLFARLTFIAALLSCLTIGWGRGALLWDQGVSLRLIKGGFLDPASPGFYTTAKGDEWLKPIESPLRLVRVSQEDAVGVSVSVDRSNQTARGEFKTSKAKGVIQWHLGARSLFLTIVVTGSEPIKVYAEGTRPWRFTEVAGTDYRVWVLHVKMPRPDSDEVADRAGGSRERVSFSESIDLAKKTDPSGWIELEGPLTDQIALAGLSQIIGRSHQNGRRAMSGPFSTTRSKYSGRTFWDADVWMMPSLSLMQPDSARRFAAMRLSQATEARRLGSAYQKAGFPKLEVEGRRRSRFPGPPKVEGIQPGSLVRYPWEADASGREAGSTESVLQEHISGSVWLGLHKAAMLGLADKAEVEKVRRGVGAWYLARSESLGAARSIKGVMSPDESAIVDDDLYTNLLAQRVTGQPFKLPKDKTSLLNYQNDEVRGYKQHAGLLALFPLQSPVAEREAKTMLERFSGKTASDGPAMSLSLEALLWARNGEPEKAYDLWLNSWQNYCRTGIFTERPKGGEEVFVTGAAGYLNSVMYGFAGLRLDDKPTPGALWQKQLKSGAYLSIRPNLPTKWKKLTLNKVQLDGVNYKLEIWKDRVLASPP